MSPVPIAVEQVERLGIGDAHRGEPVRTDSPGPRSEIANDSGDGSKPGIVRWKSSW